MQNQAKSSTKKSHKQPIASRMCSTTAAIHCHRCTLKQTDRRTQHHTHHLGLDLSRLQLAGIQEAVDNSLV